MINIFNKLVIVADDLTGAADTGVLFSRPGLPVTLIVGTDGLEKALPVSETIAVDLESRLDTATVAYNKHFSLGLSLRKATDRMIYKKLDSTFRGNIGAEIDGLMEGLQAKATLLAPALPGNGRIVRAGEVIVHGEKLINTDAATDPRTPVRSSSIEAIIASQSKRRCRLIGPTFFSAGVEPAAAELLKEIDAGGEIFIFDSLEENDLANIAGMIRRLSDNSLLLAGSSGLARHLHPTSEVGTEPGQQEKTTPLKRASGPVFVFAGSVNSRSQAQVQASLIKGNCTLIPIDPKTLEEDEAITAAIKTIREGVSSGNRNYIFTTAISRDDIVSGAGEIATAFGQFAASMIQQFHPSGMLLTGGETAIQTLESLNANGLKLLAEVLPGIQYGHLTGTAFDDSLVVTKAGGFGEADSISQIIDFLSE